MLMCRDSSERDIVCLSICCRGFDAATRPNCKCFLPASTFNVATLSKLTPFFHLHSFSVFCIVFFCELFPDMNVVLVFLYHHLVVVIIVIIIIRWFVVRPLRKHWNTDALKLPVKNAGEKLSCIALVIVFEPQDSSCIFSYDTLSSFIFKNVFWFVVLVLVSVNWKDTECRLSLVLSCCRQARLSAKWVNHFYAGNHAFVISRLSVVRRNESTRR